MTEAPTLPFQELLNTLLDEAEAVPAQLLYRLSDLEGENLARFQEIWPRVSASRRKAILADLEELAADDLVLSFEALCRFTVTDAEPLVRLPSLRILWDFESPSLVPLFLDLAANDPDVEVRACAATGLGRFIYLGEVEEIPAATLRAVEDHLLRYATGDEHPLVRRKALESLGYSSHERVPALIESAYYSDDDPWVASALFAMGRSADRRWSTEVLERLDDSNPEIRVEAIRASGELELEEAVQALLAQLDGPTEQLRLAAIWSLSQIGGQGVRSALEDLLGYTSDEGEVSFLEDALDNLIFTEGFDSFTLFDFSEEDLESSFEDMDYGDDVD